MANRERDPQPKHRGQTDVDVYLDTSVLRALGSPTVEVAQKLGQLAREGIVHVFLHSFVLREFATGVAKDLGIDLSRRSLRETMKWTDGELSKAISFVQDQAKTIEATITAAVRRLANEWDATIVELDGPQAQQAVTDYFEGSRAVKAPKNRTDIPDALVWAGAVHTQRVASTPARDLHVVAGDNGFATAVAAENKARGKTDFIHHESLADFLNSKEVAEAARAHSKWIQEQTQQEYRIRRLRQLVGNEDQEIRRAIQKGAAELAWTDVHHKDFPSDNHDATVVSVGALDSFTLEPDEAEDFGAGEVSIPFVADFVDTEVEFYVAKGWDEDDDERFRIQDSDWNRHYMLVSGTVSIQVSGYVRLYFTEDEFEQFRLSNAEAEIGEEIEVELP